MQDKKLRLSVRHDIVDRGDTASLKKTGRGWIDVEYTISELIAHIQQGHPIAHQFSNGHRKRENFRRTDILIADIDDGMTLEEAVENEFIQNFASFIYTTPRHTPEKPRFRVIFVLERSVFNPDIYEAMYRSLMLKMPTDPNAASAAQFFFGSSTAQIIAINQVLPEKQMNKMASEGVKKQIDDVTPPVTEKLTPDSLVKVKNKGLHPLRNLPANTSIHCPFKTHNDANPSAFVLVSKDGIHGVKCRSCGHQAWSEPMPTRSEFNYFDELVKKYANSENAHFHYEGITRFDHNLETSTGKSNFHLSSSKHLNIKEILQGIHLIKSPKGSGKTQAMIKIVDQIKTPSTRKRLGLSKDHQGRTILIGHRQNLIRESAQKLGLECYLDTGDYDTQIKYLGTPDSKGGWKISSVETAKPQHYAICLDSLHSRVRINHEKYDVVIIDESEQVFSHFLSEHMKHPTSNFEILSRIIKNAKLVFCLDADLDRITLSGILSCLSYSRDRERVPSSGDDVRQTQHLYCHLNTYQAPSRRIEVFTSKNQLEDDLRQSIAPGRRCYITSNSKKFVEGLYHSFSTVCPDKQFELVVSDRGDDESVRYFLRNIRTEILKKDGVFSSPSLGTGIDITFPENATEIDVVYGFFESNVNTHFDIDQQLGRIRHPGEVKVWISPARHRASTNLDKIRQELLFGNDVEGLRFYLDQNGATSSAGQHPFVDLLATVIAVRRTSMNRLRDNFISYKKNNGWHVTEVEHNELSAQRGAVINKASKKSRRKAVHERLLGAPEYSKADILKLDPLIQKNAPLTDEQKAGREKYWITTFYHQDLTKELIEFDDEGKTRERIRLLERVINPKIRHRSYEEIASRLDFFDGVKLTQDELRPVVFLRELFEVAGIFDMKSFSFIPSATYSTASLQDFINFLKNHRDRYSLVFEKDINDHLDERPTNQLGALLKMVGLKHAPIKKNRGGGVAVYQLEPLTYQSIRDIVATRKKQQSERLQPASPARGE